KADSDLVLRLTLDASRRFPLIGIGFAIRTLDGTVLIKQAPQVTGIQLRHLIGVVDVTLRLRDVLRTLTGGSYLLDLWLSYPGIEVIFMLESLMRFEIPELDLYGYGHALSQRTHGPCSLTATFSEQRY